MTSSPGGINCGGDCSETYDDGTVVNLTASPQTGSVFSGWSGDSDCNDGTLSMSADHSCTANFAALSPPTVEILSPVQQPALGRPVTSSGDEFPNRDPEQLVDGQVDLPNTYWASSGTPEWVEVDLGEPTTLDRIEVAPFAGSQGTPYFYNDAWRVEYRDTQGSVRQFSNVQKLVGAGDHFGSGISIVNGDPGTTNSLESYKFYEFSFHPTTTRYLRFYVTGGDRDGDSNGAEIVVHQVFLGGAEIRFEALASDVEDGAISSAIHWESSLDGTIGTGSTLNMSTLRIGTHIVTASVTDSTGMTAEDTIEVRVVANQEAPFQGFSDSFETGDTSAWSSVAP